MAVVLKCDYTWLKLYYDMGTPSGALPRKVRWFVYLSHALSTWGDRMWAFGVGLFMVIISPDDLRVTAIYGLSMGGAVLLFGALVGDWVDKTPRLKAARTSLVIQNSSVIVCAGIIFTVITLKTKIEGALPGDALLYLSYAVIILVAIVSTLASMGTSIAVQKDWIVEICARDKDMLATMTASLRRIDLISKLVAPIATGQIMYFASPGVGALFIAGWNFVSVFLEYFLLKKVYNLCPALAKEKSDVPLEEDMDGEEMVCLPAKHLEIEIQTNGHMDTEATDGKPTMNDGPINNLTSPKDMNKLTSLSEPSEQGMGNLYDQPEPREHDMVNITSQSETSEQNLGKATSQPEASEQDMVNLTSKSETSEQDVDNITSQLKPSKQDMVNLTSQSEPSEQDVGNIASQSEPSEQDHLQPADERDITVVYRPTQPSKKPKKDQGCTRMFSGILVLYRGWRVYMRYQVAFAGLGLACLYMTVLGFDNITVGYGYTQGINESIMGVMMAAGSVTGILGTVLYPIFHRRIGLQRTGLFSYLFEISFLCLCVASVWAPGSPFDPTFSLIKRDTTKNCSHTDVNSVNTISNNSVPMTNTTSVIYTPLQDNTSLSGEVKNLSVDMNSTDREVVSETCHTGPHSYISIILLMSGIIGARCGLWMADLTISQLFLENVRETERGIMNGVQTSLNKLMDIVKFVLVIAIPHQEQFGYLILVSFAFICLGWVLYARYSYKVRGHLFHFDRIKQCQGHNGNRQNIHVIEADEENVQPAVT
ncbi:solute carrier family 40 member 1-like isoform X2 [Mya arenaria]|uniref:solute carrier family 40 member 1-like isoform X2 n=1 Tax=Mya arenaria TaxID=6604 RepID=UPI0022DEC648|nr:solute carrier family 40 member 1-like isoform X2 [Mya arenaria]